MQFDELRVFISSTFRDLQTERAYLLNRIFPELRHRCRELGVEFTEIDLRWGLTEDAADQGLVLRLCLEEVERCPFFIGILGERYGWVPTLSDIQKDPVITQHFPWLLQGVEEGWSVTESEMYLAALSNQGKTGRFYVKLPLSAEVEILHQKILASGYPVKYFTESNELGSSIRDDWQAIIDECFGGSSKRSEEDAAHDAFRKNRLRAYVPHQSLIEEIATRLLRRESLIVHAPSGYGKSSLSAFVASNANSLLPGFDVFCHFVGASLESASVASINARLAERLLAEQASGKEIHAHADAAVRFNELTELIERPTLIIIDAVNQLADIDSELHWIPKVLPKNVVMLITSTDDHYTNKLSSRQERGLSVPKLETETKKIICQDFFRGYAKELTSDLLQTIVEDPKTSSPIFLRILLEELRLFGHHEELAARIELYLSSRDVEELLQLVLTRLEEDYTKKLVTSVLGALALVKSGLSQTELLQVLTGVNSETDQLEFVSLLHSLDYHLMRQFGLFSYFHSHIARAAVRRYLQNTDLKVQLGSVLRTVFQSEGYNSRAIIEQANINSQLEDFKEQHRLLTDWEALPTLIDIPNEFQTFRYWREVEDAKVAEMSRAYQIVASDAILKGESSNPMSLSGRLGIHLINCGRLIEGREVLTKLVELARPVVADQRDFVELLRQYSQALTNTGDLANSLAVIEEACHASESVAEDMLWAKLLVAKVHILFELGRYLEAESIAYEAHSMLAAVFGPKNQHTIEALMECANILRELGKLDQAESIHRQVLQLRIQTHGLHSFQAAVAMNDLGTFLRRFKLKLPEAESLLKESLRIMTDRLGEEHHDRATVAGNLAALLRELDKLEEAEPYYEESVRLETKLHGPRHPKTATALHNYAAFLSSLGRLKEAESGFRSVRELRLDLLGRRHAQTIVTTIMLGATLYRLGEYDAAEPYLLEAIEDQATISSPQHPTMATAFQWLGLIKAGQGHLESAKSHFIRALELRESILGSTHPLTILTQQSLGSVYAELGDLERAREYLTQAFSCLEALHGRDHPKTKEVAEKLEALSSPESAKLG